MAVPKKRTSKSASKTRHSTWVALNRTRLVRATNVVRCSSCSEPKLSHTVCPACNAAGNMKMKDVVSPQEA